MLVFASGNRAAGFWLTDRARSTGAHYPVSILNPPRNRAEHSFTKVNRQRIQAVDGDQVIRKRWWIVDLAPSASGSGESEDRVSQETRYIWMLTSIEMQNTVVRAT